MKNIIPVILVVCGAVVVWILSKEEAQTETSAGPDIIHATSDSDVHLEPPQNDVLSDSTAAQITWPAASPSEESVSASVLNNIKEPAVSDQAYEPDAVLPAGHIAWVQEKQLRQFLEMDAGELQKFQADYQSWIGGDLARGAGLTLRAEEVRQLSDVFMDATLGFCQLWHPIYVEGLQTAGEARDRIALNNAIDPDMMLMLYAVPSKEKEISAIIGKDNYEKIKGVVDDSFQEWYRDVEFEAEFQTFSASLTDHEKQQVGQAFDRWSESEAAKGSPTIKRWFDSEEFRQLREQLGK